jgi:hypothetical protein
MDPVEFVGVYHDEIFKVSRCTRCGSLVANGHEATHQEWHESIGDVDS